jgi:predicted nucleic acid-binding protein
MGKVIPFSRLASEANDTGCFLDTNFLICLLHNDHNFNSEAKSLFEVMVTNNIELFITHTIRAEFLDFQRRYLLTRKLEDVANSLGIWKHKTSDKFKELAKSEIKNIKSSDIRILTDSQIKNLRKRVFPNSNYAFVGWIAFCKYFLNNEVSKAWGDIEKIGINYLNLREAEDAGDKAFLHKKIEWEDLVAVIGATGIGAHDGMILNAFNCSNFDFIISTDLDIAYSIKHSSLDKVAVIPDSLYSTYHRLF